MSFVVIAYFLSLAGLGLFGLHRLFLLILYWKVRHHRPPVPLNETQWPMVTIQLPIYNERYVARRLVIACARMDYPRERMEIQVLDDSTDCTAPRLEVLVRRLRHLGIPVSYLHRAKRSGYKAGALAEGLKVARGEYVALFDADFLPPSDFLRHTVGYFADPTVAMVQARWDHLNRDFSLLTRLQSIFLDGHFYIEHVARHRTGRFFNFNGTAGVWRKESIAAAGGWQGDTLTEDLDLSYRAQIAGWHFVYLDDVSSAAELPSDMGAFKAQQHRWAKGSIQTARKLLPLVLRSRLPWKVKLEAFFHLTNNMAYLLMVIPCFLWVPTLLRRFDTQHPIYLAFAAAFACTTLFVIAYHVACQMAAGQSFWKTIGLVPALLGLGIGMSLNNGKAVIEALLGHQSPFQRTPKYGTHGQNRDVHGQRGSEARFYQVRVNALAWLELAMAAYFGVGLWIAVVYHRWLAIPFLLLFLGGFAYVGLSSLGHRLHRMVRVGSLGAALGLMILGVWISHVVFHVG